jgi:hypothetical protein
VPKQKKTDELALPESLSGEAPLQLSEELIGGVVQNISSPVEMAALIKSTGVEFSQKVLNNTDKTSDYNTGFKRALNLGVYSADLGYINMFDKTNIVVSYLMAVKTMAEGIKVGQFFDFNALKRMATNSNNLDSLMEISVSSMNKMDSYLREQNRSNVSALIVAGAWIEGLYIASNVIEQTNNQELTNRIAEQKEIVDILLIIKQLQKRREFCKTRNGNRKITERLQQRKNHYRNRYSREKRDRRKTHYNTKRNKQRRNITRNIG